MVSDTYFIWVLLIWKTSQKKMVHTISSYVYLYTNLVSNLLTNFHIFYICIRASPIRMWMGPFSSLIEFVRVKWYLWAKVSHQNFAMACFPYAETKNFTRICNIFESFLCRSASWETSLFGLIESLARWMQARAIQWPRQIFTCL